MRFNPEKYDPKQDSSKGHQKDGVLVLAQKTKKDGDHEITSCASGSLEFPSNRKSKFVQGGDARLKGRLIRAHLTGTKVVRVIDGKAGKAGTALAVAKEHGFEKQIKAADDRFKKAQAKKAA